jgi:DASS family divalent anion:Na+ symporter
MTRPSRRYRILIVIAFGAALWFLPRPLAVAPQAWRLFAVFAATILGLILQPMAGGAVVLFGLVAAVLTRAMTAPGALAGFSNSSVWLIVSAFLFSHAVSATGLGRRLAFTFIRAFGDRTLKLGYALVASEFVIAPAVPANTARIGGILFPIISGISEACGSFPDRSPRRIGAFLMVNQFHATITMSAMFLTAMAANPLIAELAARNLGVRISWGTWALAALVPGLLALVVIPWALYKLYPPELAESPKACEEAHRRLEEMGPMRRSEIILAIIVSGCLLMWTTTGVHHLDPTTVAFLGLAAMLVAGVMSWEDVVMNHGAWDAMFWFGGLIAMADGLGQLGMTTWFARAVANYVHGQWWWILLVLSLAYFYSHYAFASMTAHVTAMYLPFLTVAVAAGAPPLLAALLLAFLSNLNASITHYSTGPAPILFGAGYVDQATWWKLGFVVSIINLIIWLGVGVPYWKLIGIW